LLPLTVFNYGIAWPFSMFPAPENYSCSIFNLSGLSVETKILI
jgi:hypothetical protein